MVNVRPGPNGNVFFFDPNAHRHRRPRESAVPRASDDARRAGQYVYLYGPGLWTVDLGSAKTFRLAGASAFNFEALFINAFNHRNTTVGGTGGATLSIDSTTFGQSTGLAIGSRQVQFRVGINFSTHVGVTCCRESNLRESCTRPDAVSFRPPALLPPHSLQPAETSEAAQSIPPSIASLKPFPGRGSTDHRR